MSYPTRKNLVVAISPTPYANPLLMDMVPDDALFFLGVDIATSNPSGVALVGKGGAGGPYTFTTLAGTPVTAGFEPAPGITLNPDGTITGIPAAQGVYRFVAQVEDVGSNTHAASFSINVQSGLIPVVFQPTIGENGIAYRFEFIVRDLSGVTITSGFSVVAGTLPNGLVIAGGNTNVITGTPTALSVGDTDVTIRATVGSASVDIPCTFTIVDEVALTFIESIDPPNGWGGGAGTWLPSVTRGIPYVAHLSISGGVPPYSVSMSAVDPWPTEFLLSNQLLQVAGKTLDAASTVNPRLSAVTVTDALGGVDTAQRAYFIINQPNARIQPRKNGVDAPGGDGIVNFDFIEGDNVTLDMSTDGYTTHLTIHAHPPSGSLTINGVHPDSSGNWQISGLFIDSNGDLVIPAATGGVISFNGASGAVTETAVDGSIGFVNTTGVGGNIDLTARMLADAATTAALPSCTYSNGTAGVGATLTGISNGALAAQDGVTLTANQHLLVKDQASGLQNGRYKLTQVGDGSHPFILTRSTRMDSSGKFVGAQVFIVGGSTQATRLFTCSNTAAPTIGTTDITFQSSGPVLRAPGCDFTNGGLALVGTLSDEIPLPYGGIITGWTIVGDTTGSVSIAVSHSTYAAYDTMTSLFTATVSSAKKNQATGLSYAVSAGDVVRFVGSGFSGMTRCCIVLTVVPI